MRCYVRESGRIRDLQPDESVYVDQQEISRPIGVDLDFQAVRHVVESQGRQWAEIARGKVEIRQAGSAPVSVPVTPSVSVPVAAKTTAQRTKTKTRSDTGKRSSGARTKTAKKTAAKRINKTG